jgi:hypothetical protein
MPFVWHLGLGTPALLLALLQKLTQKEIGM